MECFISIISINLFLISLTFIFLLKLKCNAEFLKISLQFPNSFTLIFITDEFHNLLKFLE
ncbi:MAG: DUF2768 family protein [Candidatus Fonsibacter ubiquis]|nr:DUF2768 family protein [Candidatus Fonsibacter ubiquis]NCW71276.1 DUF2768 family protein [Pseudomonadota bacterium]NCU62207.1 DUF2768 family protein [Candidatus Fonsibacter ubiquis]NCU68866.1 DUF2768 family protein [Candidatus Fonsibacter ubiquis]NDB38603.1 DUF2768 family protein [Pseudomonadota bacterium]